MAKLSGGDGTAYDYIVIGSGSAGSVLANRLSADPQNRVILIEAGPSDRRWPTNLKTALPVGNIFLIQHAKYNWQHVLTGNESIGFRTINFPRGKLIGGCSAINGGVYVRGQREDYDAWARAGNPGWSFDDALPAFKAMEHYAGPDRPWHGKGGELDVQKPRSFNPISAAIVDAAEQAGHRRNDDFAGPSQAGFGRYDLNQRNGSRLSAARAFLHPVLRRPNLTVLTDTLVRQIVIERGRATGVKVETSGGKRFIAAVREVVLSAGTINSPQLLMLSGVGPEDHLREKGIEVVHALPGVGAHLQDHPTVHVSMENPSAESYAVTAQALPRILMSPFHYLFRRSGMLASNVAECGGFLCTDGSGRPDIQITFLVGLKVSARVMPRAHGYMALIQLLRPKSAGAVRLASNRPDDKPVIEPNFFADPNDMRTLIAGFREARRIFAQPALAKMTGAEIEPGTQYQSDRDIDDQLRKIVNTAYHPSGTCKMGPDSDPLAVVDARLNVHGIAGLRVADASIMPEIISGNISAPTMMIAERAAQFIREDAAVTELAA